MYYTVILKYINWMKTKNVTYSYFFHGIIIDLETIYDCVDLTGLGNDFRAFLGGVFSHSSKKSFFDEKSLLLPLELRGLGSGLQMKIGTMKRYIFMYTLYIQVIHFAYRYTVRKRPYLKSLSNFQVHSQLSLVKVLNLQNFI